MDWTAITAAVDFTDVLAAASAIVVAAFGIRVALKGVSLARSALGKA